MTDEAVQISITTKIAELERKIEKVIRPEGLEAAVQGIAIPTEQESFEMSIQKIETKLQSRCLKDGGMLGQKNAG